MFINKTAAIEKELATAKHTHELAMQRAEQEKSLALKEKEFELKHFKDEELKKLAGELATAKQSNAVLTKENEMLAKITDLNADIIDVKDLVSKLIDKLPEVKLNNLTVHNGPNDK